MSREREREGNELVVPKSLKALFTLLRFYFNCNNCNSNNNNNCPGVQALGVGSWIFHTYIKQTKENARKIERKKQHNQRPGEACKQTFQNSEFLFHCMPSLNEK